MDLSFYILKVVQFGEIGKNVSWTGVDLCRSKLLDWLMQQTLKLLM
jgi:hypothetical protein